MFASRRRTRSAAALALVAAHPRRGELDPRHRLAGRRRGPRPDGGRARRGHGRHAGCSVVEGLPLALAQHRRPRPCRRRASTSPAASSSAAPTASQRGSCGRSRRGASASAIVTVTEDEWVDATREGIRVANARGVARDPRQGRLARRGLDLRPDPRAGGADAPRLAVAPGRPAGRDLGTAAARRASATTSSGSAT